MTGSALNRVLVPFKFGPRRFKGDTAIIAFVQPNQPKLLHQFLRNFAQEKLFIVVYARGEVCYVRFFVDNFHLTKKQELE